MRQSKYLISFIFVITLFFSCTSQNHNPVSKTDFMMGTYVSITSHDYEIDEKTINTAIEAAFDTIKIIEEKTNTYDKNSIVGKLNSQNDSLRKTILDPQIAELVKQAIQIAETTNGRFDFTLWPVFRLWHFDTDSAAIPSPESIKSALAKVDYRNVILNGNELTIAAGTEIDFGGIAKGFAVEAARKTLLEHGLNNFIIDAGGNLGIEWQKVQPVQIIVRHPRKDGEFWGEFPIQESCGIATSGDYHFYFIRDGKRYHHLLNPQTGFPAENAVNATIIAPTATIADGYSTAAFIMGAESGKAFMEANAELDGLMIYQKNDSLRTYLSPALREGFVFH